MKRILPLVAMLCVAVSALAQPHQPNTPPPARYTVRFESRANEAFSVYIDGNLQNHMPQSRVIVNDVSDQTHEVVVVLKRPAEKAAVMQLRPGEPNVVVNINYDPRLEQLYLYTPAYNKPEQAAPVAITPPQQRPGTGGNARPRKPHEREEAVQPINTPQPATPDQLNAMAAQMRAQSFDSDRLALGKALVASNYFTAQQIAYLAQTIDYSQSQVEFLKYAYAYCIDRNNYATVVGILTYSSDKQKVLDFIATQR